MNRGIYTAVAIVVVVARHVMIRVVVGRVAATAVVISISVVVWIHRRHVVRMTWSRRRHRRTIAVVIVAVLAWTVIVAWTRSDIDDHPRLVAIAVPAKTHWLKVLKHREAVELVTQFVVRHHRVNP